MTKIAKYEKVRSKKGKAKTHRTIRPRKNYGDPYAYDPIETWVWREFSSSKSVDVYEFIEKYKDRNFFIGTDSQSYSKSGVCVYTTVLIAHNRFRGGSVIRYTDKRSFVPFEALSAKLIVETQRSIEVCQMLEAELMKLSSKEIDRLCIEAEAEGRDLNEKEVNIDYTKNIIGVSIDCNRDSIHASGKYKETLVGMVMGYGYRAFIKPDAWAASSVADARC